MTETIEHMLGEKENSFKVRKDCYLSILFSFHMSGCFMVALEMCD